MSSLRHVVFSSFEWPSAQGHKLYFQQFLEGHMSQQQSVATAGVWPTVYDSKVLVQIMHNFNSTVRMEFGRLRKLVTLSAAGHRFLQK